MIVAKSTVHDCSATDYPATRRSAFASGLALVGGTDMPAHRRGPAEQAMCFGTFHLLPRQRLLVENGSRALDILVALVERAGHVVEKRELMARIWPDSSVEESNLKVHVAALRRTLGDGLPGRRYVAASRGTPRKSHPVARVSAAAVTLRWLRDGTEQMHECAWRTPALRRRNLEDTVMARTMALPIVSAASGLSHYREEIRRFPMLEPQEEYMLARSWREHGDREAAHKLVTSHLRLVAKIAMGYRGYGLPISEVISEGNVGLMQAVKRFEPEKGFRLATYAMWWIKAAIQEYILRSWSLVKMGTTANQKKLFFNLRKAKSKISALEEGDLRPDQVETIAKRLGVTEQDVIDMNRRLGGDASLNAPIRDDGESGEWQDWLVDEAPSQERILAESEESDNRHKALVSALDVLNERERRIFEARRLADDPITLEELAAEFGVSRERVRQIELRAFEKIQKAVKARIATMGRQPAALAIDSEVCHV